MSPIQLQQRDFIKVVGTMIRNPNRMTVVATIISLAHPIGLTVIAEGVENSELAGFLRVLRCDELQCYLYSFPIPFNALRAKRL